MSRYSGVIQVVFSGTFQIRRLDFFEHGRRRTTDRALVGRLVAVMDITANSASPSSQEILLVLAGFLIKGIADRHCRRQSIIDRFERCAQICYQFPTGDDYE